MAVEQNYLLEIVQQRLAGVEILPELHSALINLITDDQQHIIHGKRWGWLIPELTILLNGTDQMTKIFAAAWSIMFAATIHLDTLQDNDTAETPILTEGSIESRYNLTISYYVLASSLLDDLPVEIIPYQRIQNLRRLWSDLTLRTASGQHRDLIVANQQINKSPLQDYQELAQAKTGSAFALAFGGTAAIISSNRQIIDLFLLVGEIFGTMIQYLDDLQDTNQQTNITLTLPKALKSALPSDSLNSAFCAHIYKEYMKHIHKILADTPDSIKFGVLDIFKRTFEKYHHTYETNNE